ncbi:MAG: aldehyde dehydrogenase (NADP(+)), partial [Verrucomicrobiota bacterium]
AGLLEEVSFLSTARAGHWTALGSPARIGGMELTGKNLIGGRESGVGEATLRGVNPVDGRELQTSFYEASEVEVEEAMTLAAEAAKQMRTYPAEKLAGLCEAIAAKLEEHKVALLDRCGAECAYPEARLNGEFGRTVGQLRQFAAVAREGAWMEAKIDHADPDRQPLPKPDVRSMRRPIGPIVVFGASNFPLALSCAGGDTASALAASCPVVVKGHPSHPGTCEIAGRAIVEAVEECGFPAGTFSLLQGASNDLGKMLVEHEATAAVGFTGSLRGGRALFDLAAARETPIPVYAEMGSFNPQFVFAGKLEAEPEAFAEALFGSMTMGNGQFCTNPGLVFMPQGDGTEKFLAKYRELIEATPGSAMLNAGIQAAFESGVDTVAKLDGVEIVRGEVSGDGCQVGLALVTLSQGTFEANRDAFEEEIFGPSTVVVICPDETGYAMLAEGFPGQLASSIHGTPADFEGAGELMEVLSEYAGRLLVNGFPTGIEICHAMHHGGLYPAATSAQFTSIGLSSIARWGRPVSYQSAPDSLLPDALKEGNPLGIPRLVDGKLS